MIRNVLLFGLCVTMASALIDGLRTSYQNWQHKEFQRIQTRGLIAETALGAVEYQLAGRGPAVIYAHGSPGGYDQGVSFIHFLEGRKTNCLFISPSRPGYLRTPLSSGATPEEQADLYAALLDTLGLEKASILGFSGGGPSALQFALRYPDRCRSLVMIGAIAQRNDIHGRMKTMPIFQHVILKVIEALLVSDPFLFFAVPIAQRAPYGTALSGMICSGTHYALRRAGYENDLAQFARLQPYPLAKISVPTLIVHGNKDRDVPFIDAELMAREIPQAKFLRLDGDHMAFYTYNKTVIPLVYEYLTKDR